MGRPRILIADDHGIFVIGLRHILEPRYEVLEAVEDGHSLIRRALEERPDLIIADISMPLLNGIDAIRQIRKRERRIKALILTMHPDVTYLREALDAGVMGYVLKHAVTSELIEAVRQVLDGKRFISQPLAAQAEAELAKLGSGRKRKLTTDLTPRQREVLQLVGEGRSAKEIADILFISARTADFHKQELRKRLGVRTTAELVQKAVKLGLVGTSGLVER